MKRIWMALVLLAAGSIAAAEALQVPTNFEFGRSALDAGNYRQAADFFSQALTEVKNDREHQRVLLYLGEAKLRGGDLDGADKAVQEFRKKYPGAFTGVLPAAILLARGEVAQSRQLVEESLRKKDLEVRERRLVELLYGHLLMLAKEYDKAEKILLDLEKNDMPSLCRNARILRIRLCLNRQDKAGAEKLIAETAKDARFSGLKDMLELFSFHAAALDAGVKLDLKARWQELREKFPPQPHQEAWQLLGVLAEHPKSRENGDYFYKELRRYAINDHQRADALLGLFNYYLRRGSKDLLPAAMLFYREYPDHPKRIDILFSAAEYLKSRNPDGCLSCLETILNDSKAAREDKFKAAVSAAEVAAKYAAEREENFRKLAVEYAVSPAAQADAQAAYAEFLLSKKRFAEAEKAAGKVVALSGNGEQDDRVRHLQLRTQLASGRNELALVTAKTLLDSKVENYAEHALYECAVLSEKIKDYLHARSYYLDFIRRFGASSYAVDAKLSAARLAYKLSMLPDAKEEFKNFFSSYPEHPFSAAAAVWAMRTIFRMNPLNGGENIIPESNSLLKSLFLLPGHLMEKAAAAVEYSAYLREIGKGVEAADVLELVTPVLLPPEGVIPPEEKALRQEATGIVALEKLRVLLADKMDNEVLNVYNENRSKISGSRLAAASYIAAQSARRIHNSKLAAELLKTALENEKDAALTEIINDELAAIYSEDAGKIKLALPIYEKLCSSSSPEMRIKAHCQMGSLLVREQRYREGFDAYKRCLLLAAAASRRQIDCGNYPFLAAEGALKLVRENDLTVPREEAMEIFNLYRMLPGRSEQNFKAIKQELDELLARQETIQR